MKKSFKSYGAILLIVGVAMLSGCATYYEKSDAFQEQFVRGDLDKANQILDKNKKAAKDKDRLLYFLQKGVVLQVLEKYDDSNQFFEEAYIFSEDYRKNYVREMVSLISNPMVRPYVGEDHEIVLLHYFKALNYLRINKTEDALVEIRRINNKLNQLNDRYEKKKNRYKQDAFALNLMGITYESSGDINNAFIAYRNAYEAYIGDYKTNFQTNAPEQLKKDLLRTAYLNGFTEELQQYEKKFSMTYKHQEKGAELVFFWHNGLGPVKDERSINFLIVRGQGSVVTFINEELGLSIPFPSAKTDGGGNGLGDLKFVRVAFPKYLERKPYYQNGELSVDGIHYPLETGENINEIAFKTLEDRMVRELGVSLMRLAVKQATEHKVRAKNENIGALLSVINAVSEKSDTRNWQTLPYSISYARIPLKAGDNTVDLKIYSPRKSRDRKTSFNFKAEKGATIFHIYNNLESSPLGAY